ncbi:hypothetical protein JRK10_002351 [Salmonella enterica]|nr:hypothetical protein [Salmonella enterica]EIE2767488.1 hypothetical protein [Salmonella enterica subsp. enterica serovar Rubislaw]EFP0251664.1 hypothetical protein [Salmonella enterica]EHD2122850.1 hypothetical protein [Salmonella enterica]EIT8511420.1 hypothetical protein [Salmonella enterica]
MREHPTTELAAQLASLIAVLSTANIEPQHYGRLLKLSGYVVDELVASLVERDEMEG